MPSISVPAAIGIGAGVSGAAAIGGSMISSSASQSAASEQTAADNASINTQTQEFNQDQANLAPYNTNGQNALSSLDTIYGLPGGNGINPLTANGISGLTFQPTEAQLEATPGYQFDLQQGQQAVANSNAAAGTGISGAALKGAANYATGLANNTLTTQEGIFQSNLGNVLGPLNTMANLGENAGAQAGAQGTQAAANIGNTEVGEGNAEAAGTTGSASAISGGLTSALNTAGSSPLNYLMYNSLLGTGTATGNAAASNYGVGASADGEATLSM